MAKIAIFDGENWIKNRIRSNSKPYTTFKNTQEQITETKRAKQFKIKVYSGGLCTPK